MKRFAQWFFTAAVFLCFAGSAKAQNVTLHFTPSSSGGSSTNVYRAPCPAVAGTTQANGAVVGTCAAPGTFMIVGNAPLGATSYGDTALKFATGYAYEVTALCPAAGCTDGSGGESVPTPILGAQTTPAPKPQTPTGFTLTVP